MARKDTCMSSLQTSTAARDCALTHAICAAILSRHVGKDAALTACERYGAKSLSFRALVASLGSAGGFLIPSTLDGAAVIYALRAHTVIRRHIPRENIIATPHGNVTLGRADTAATVGGIGVSQPLEL